MNAWAAMGLTAIVLPLAAAQALVLAVSPREVIVRLSVPELGPDLLAPQVGPWIKRSHKAHQRDPGSIYGQFSQEFVLARGPSAVILSLDYPFGERHDLSVCYRGQGWQIGQTAALPLSPQDSQITVVQMDMAKPASGQHAVVLSVYFDGDRRLEPVHGASLAAQLSLRLGKFQRLLEGYQLVASGESEVVYQLQIVVTSVLPIGEELKQELRELLKASLDQIHRNWPKSATEDR